MRYPITHALYNGTTISCQKVLRDFDANPSGCMNNYEYRAWIVRTEPGCFAAYGNTEEEAFDNMKEVVDEYAKQGETK